MKYDFKCKKKLDLTIIFALEGSRLQFEKNVYNSLGWQMQYKMDLLFVFMAIADYLFSIKHEKLQMKLSKARSWSHFYNNFVM